MLEHYFHLLPTIFALQNVVAINVLLIFANKSPSADLLLLDHQGRLLGKFPYYNSSEQLDCLAAIILLDRYQGFYKPDLVSLFL